MAHVFYPDLIEEFVRDLSTIPVPFVLMVSVTDKGAHAEAMARFSTISNAVEVHVRIFPNRGRDIAPMLVAFKEEILALDVVCHIHTKKSLYAGKELGNWRRYLIDSLLGSGPRIAWILGTFQATPSLGMVYPESFAAVPLTAHTWLSNKDHARLLGSQLGIEVDGDSYLDFAAGSMFWARTEALRPLLSLGLTIESFPEEKGQTDGTLQHTIERLFVPILRQQGMIIGVLPSNGDLVLGTEGARNWHTYFDQPIADRVALGSVDAKVVSFDLFDTLVLRSFLKPAGAREYLAYLVKKRYKFEGFVNLREDAEHRARLVTGTDADIESIYRSMASMPQAKGLPLASIFALELATEKRHLRPRQALVDAALRMGKAGKSIVAVSDMYLNSRDLRSLLPQPVNDAITRIYVSCETGWRKDTGEAWENLPKQLDTKVGQWLHVGDNEHSDIQLPFSQGFVPPVHALRTHALLDVVPALRAIRPSPQQSSSWANQLWLGLIGNRLLELADERPEAFDSGLTIKDPETAGYIVLGPLVLDYLTWLAHVASSEQADAILFLSREGFLLKRAYDIIRKVAPDETPSGIYLLASRRGVGTPSMRAFSDLEHLLGGTYTGPLSNLLYARMGAETAEVGASRLGDATMKIEVYLPEMRSRIMQILEPVAAEMMEVAEKERSAYMNYWNDHVAATRPIVADLGYAGTIQSHLSRLVQRKLGGAYFALNARARQLDVTGSIAQARYCDFRQSDRPSCPVMHHHLLLEGILTSPDGQFSHFEQGIGRPRAEFTPPSNPQYSCIADVQRGIESFINDVCDLVGEDVMSMEIDPVLVQQPLECLGSGLWRTGRWISMLKLDDHFSGRGDILVRNS